MIDNYEQATELVQKMEMHLPIPARATKALLNFLRNKDIQLPNDGEVLIEKVFYMGDEGGIACGLERPTGHKQDKALVVSLTHLHIKSSHPLAKEIAAYQKQRTKKLAPTKKTNRLKSIKVKRRRRK